ncbi:MAG: decarboxylating NADP(+)-dependent phosphogluconate dehydrogenase [Oleiphilus sp.]
MNADIAVIGLAVMGQNLILNMNDKGFHVLAYNRSPEKTKAFIEGEAAETNIRAVYSLEALVSGLATPRKILMMVKAGEAVDALIGQLTSLLSPGDILIDGGNSNFTDTTRRVEYLATQEIFYLGCGISGGEEGARFGPSIMPGGSFQAWQAVKPILQGISARAEDGSPCCDWVGEGGAGHFVKMVHNGIEYGDMQLISEAYHFMQVALGMSNQAMHRVFSEWNTTELDSYLIKITAEILNTKDENDDFVLDQILDSAGQKGTGKWTSIHALNLGIPLNLITESVFARCVSALKQQRILAASVYPRETPTLTYPESWIEDIHAALLASKVLSYAQGFMLMSEASHEYGWNLNLANVALLWRGGCIIQSRFLQNIADAFIKDPQLSFLGLDEYFKSILDKALPSWRKLACKSLEIGLPMPCTVSALGFLDAYTSARLPANMIQAQRDYFGAHTFERVDMPEGEFFHHDWLSK